MIAQIAWNCTFNHIHKLHKRSPKELRFDTFEEAIPGSNKGIATSSKSATSS